MAIGPDKSKVAKSVDLLEAACTIAQPQAVSSRLHGIFNRNLTRRPSRVTSPTWRFLLVRVFTIDPVTQHYTATSKPETVLYTGTVLPITTGTSHTGIPSPTGRTRSYPPGKL